MEAVVTPKAKVGKLSKSTTTRAFSKEMKTGRGNIIFSKDGTMVINQLAEALVASLAKCAGRYAKAAGRYTMKSGDIHMALESKM